MLKSSTSPRTEQPIGQYLFSWRLIPRLPKGIPSIMLAEGDLIQVFTNAQINFYVSYVMQMSDTPLTYQIPNTR